MKKKTMLALAAACCLSMTIPAAVSAAETEAAGEADAATDDTVAVEGGLSDNIYDFQVEISGDLFQFPMSYADFTALGWTLDDTEDPEMKITSNSYGGVNFSRGELSVRADVINLGVNEAPMTECLVGGISIDEGVSDKDLSPLGINLAKGITMGKSNVDDIKSAYGDPSDTYDADLYTKLTYQKDLYQDIELYVYNYK